MPSETLDKSKKLAHNSRIDALKAVSRAKAAHIASSLSLIDILSVIYSFYEEDHIVVSKGHAAAGTYSVLVNKGIIPREWLDKYCEDGFPLGGHVTSKGIPGIELSTGSLGHGLPYSLGVALGYKRLGNTRKCFVIMSDGECDEGTTWESALIASHNRLDNLTVLVDRNRLQSLSGTEDTLALEPFDKKWESFGWDVAVADGHDHRALQQALARPVAAGKPKIIICNTVKGKGVSFMENQIRWHYRPPSPEDLSKALVELGAEL